MIMKTISMTEDDYDRLMEDYEYYKCYESDDSGACHLGCTIAEIIKKDLEE